MHAALLLVLLLFVGCDKPAARERVISGVLSYRERMSLPPDAEITVSVEDVSLQDVKSKPVATQLRTADGRQVPIPFELRVAAANIDERMT